MSEETTSQQEAPVTGAKKRPTFLTVLCILSFIAIGITIITSVVGYAGMSALSSFGGEFENAWNEGMAELEDAEGLDDLSAAWGEAMGEIGGGVSTLIEYASLLLIIGILVAIIALIGVIMMWKLKKVGFFIYTGAQLIGILLPVVIAGSIAFSTVGTFFSVAFIVMYGLNLKHME
jgi:hypothetical protein